jgi:hypothetical protein
LRENCPATYKQLARSRRFGSFAFVKNDSLVSRQDLHGQGERCNKLEKEKLTHDCAVLFFSPKQLFNPEEVHE